MSSLSFYLELHNRLNSFSASSYFLYRTDFFFFLVFQHKAAFMISFSSTCWIIFLIYFQRSSPLHSFNDLLCSLINFLRFSQITQDKMKCSHQLIRQSCENCADSCMLYSIYFICAFTHIFKIIVP